LWYIVEALGGSGDMKKHWKSGKVEITICGAVVVVKFFNITFEKIGWMWQLTNAVV